MATDQRIASPSGRRVIKRYSNRKLYDTTDSRYVTLQQIGEIVRRGEDVQIIDNKTKEDKTEATLALILSADLKNKPRSIPLGTLRTLIQERSEKVLESLRETPLGRLMKGGEEEGEGEVSEPGEHPTASVEPLAEEVPTADDDKAHKGRLEELVSTSRNTLDQLQASLDERVAAAIPGAGAIREMRSALQDLTRRVAALEEHVGIERPADADPE